MVALSSGVPRPEEANVVLESQDFRKPAGVLLHFSRVSSLMVSNFPVGWLLGLTV